MDEIFPLRHIDCYMIDVTIEMLNTNLKLLTIFGDSFECKLTFKINKKLFFLKTISIILDVAKQVIKTCPRNIKVKKQKT